MRVLHVLAERGYSGGEHQLRAVIEDLARRGHENHMILNPTARFEATAREFGAQLHFVRMRNDADVFASARIRRLFRAVDPDLIHFACSRSHKLGAHASIRMRGLAPRVVTRRMDYPLGSSRYRKWLYGTAVQAVVAVSRGVAREVLATGAEEASVHVIHDGVDAPHLAELRASKLRDAERARLSIREGTLAGLTTASLHRRKGHDVLLRALAELRDRFGGDSAERLVWIVAGDGPEGETLEALADSLGLLDADAAVSVRFVGKVAVDAVLAAADLFALPSRKEGLGVALLEAMASGLPVVASAVGGMLDAVSADSGLLVSVEDSVELARAIDRLRRDPGLREEFGGNARARVASKFSIDEMCRKTVALYAKLTQGAFGSA